MKKIFAILMALSLCGVAVYTAIAASGRESKQLPPSEFEIMYSTEDHAIKVKDINDVVRFKVFPDGTMGIFDKAGNTTYGINSQTGSGVTGEAVAFLGGTTGTLLWSTAGSTTGWVLTAANLGRYKDFIVDPQGYGVTYYTDGTAVGSAKVGATVYLTDCLTAVVHGKTWTFMNISGTTPFILYDKNGRFNGGSGTTQTYPGSSTSAPEDKGDTITIKAVYYPSEVSGWYVTNVFTYD